MYRMIMVDDEPWTLLGLSTLLPWEAEGFRVEAACTDPGEALARIRSNPPDAVITDIRMPGLSGLDLMRQAREEGIGSEFVLISAYSDFRLAQEAIRNGAFDYMLKPFERDEIRGMAMRLNARLAEKAGGAQTRSARNGRQRMTEWCRTHRGGRCMVALSEERDSDWPNVERGEQLDFLDSEGRRGLLLHLPAAEPVPEWLAASDGRRRIGVSRIMSDFDALPERMQESLDSLRMAFRFSQHPQTAAIQAYIAGHFAEELTLPHVSQTFFLSEKYICELFKRHAGTTMVTFLMTLRMQMAARLIDEGGLSLQEIAARTGYPNYSYFGRVFKHWFGVSPDQHRRTATLPATAPAG